MMITCPKCGFSQPQDRYCAKCGVDMENYTPEAPSVLQKLISNPLVYIFFGFLFIIAAIFLVKQNKKEDFVNQFKNFKNSGSFTSYIVSTPTSTEFNHSSHIKTETTVKAEKAPDSSSNSVEASKVPASEMINLHLLAAEVDHQTMENLRQESRSTGQFTEFGDFKAGALATNRKATTERGVRVLYKTDEKLDHDHMVVSSNIGQNRSDGTMLGISYTVSLNHIEANSIRGEIEVLQNFHESSDPNEPPVQRSYPSTTFELTPGQSWMVTLTLPTAPQEESDSSSADGIMRIFQSPQYKSKQTEFTLFFEFDRSAGTQNAGKNSP